MMCWALLILCVLAVLGLIHAFYIEHTDWNYGVCKKSGQPWVSFAVDSSGAIGYKDDCGNCIWISYSTVRLANYINKLRK